MVSKFRGASAAAAKDRTEHAASIEITMRLRFPQEFAVDSFAFFSFYCRRGKFLLCFRAQYGQSCKTFFMSAMNERMRLALELE